MKTTIQTISVITITLFFLFTGYSYGQNQKFGIKGGFNLSGIVLGEFDPYYENESKTGFNFFVSYDFYNNSFLSLSAETGFNQKGFKYNSITRNGSGEYISSGISENTFNYADISFNSKFLYRNKSVSPYISLTPTLGIFAGNSLSSADSLSAYFDNYIFDSLKTVTFGIKIGAGVEIYNLLKNVPVIFEIRYNPDFTESYNQFHVEIKNRSFELNLGIKF